MPVWGVLLCLLTAMCWAVSPILMKIGMMRAGPNEVNPVRSLGFFITMLIAMLLLQPGKWPSATPLLLIGIIVNTGLGAILGDQMYIHSINRIGASLAVSISCGYPLVTTAFSIWVLKESITSLIWAGTLMIVAGLLIIRFDATKKRDGEDIDKGSGESSNMLKGIALAIGAALLWGANIPFVKKLMVDGNWSPAEFYFLRSIAFMLMAWFIRVIQCRWFPHAVMPIKKIPIRTWAAFLAGGSVALAIGGLLFGVCVDVLPVSVVTPITASSPFITVLLARFIHKERLSKLQRAGVTFVILGAIAVSL